MLNTDYLTDTIMTNLFGLRMVEGYDIPNGLGNYLHTDVYKMNMNRHEQFIKTGNYGRGGKTDSLAIEWICTLNGVSKTPGKTSKVGVMIASNMGRPGGACYRQDSGNPKFCNMEDASTQEESVLSFIHKRAKDTRILLANLEQLHKRYGMSDPSGDDEDFFVQRTPLQMQQANDKSPTFNVRTSKTVADYAREFGFDINVNSLDTRYQHDVYLSFVAAPNAQSPGGDLKPRKRTSPDTVFRTYSMAAAGDQFLFTDMVKAALIASLRGMAAEKCTHVIMAAPGSGLYAGRWKNDIQTNYYELCRNALVAVYNSDRIVFDAVIIPDFG
jgi:hypothetical protein